MPSAEQTARAYEELANGYGELRDDPMRDRFLVLAADAHLVAGQPDRAEGLRRRLLQHNPHHMLKPYTSLAESMKSGDVRTYVAGLRRNYPPERLGQLADMLNRARAAKAPAAAPAAGASLPASLRLADPATGPPRPPGPAARPAAPAPAGLRPADVYAVLPPVAGPVPDGAAAAEAEPPPGAWVCMALFWLLLVAAVAWTIYVLGRPFLAH